MHFPTEINIAQYFDSNSEYLYTCMCVYAEKIAILVNYIYIHDIDCCHFDIDQNEILTR